MSEKPTYEALEQKINKLTEVVELLQTEDALRQSQRRYQALYENTPGMLHSIDVHGRLVSVSNYWLEVLGYERDEVIGKSSTAFLTAASQRYAEKVVLPEFFKKGVCKDIPYQMVKKNGEIIDILLSATVERDADGQMVRSIAVLTDVTDRNRAVRALRKSEHQLRASEHELKSILNNAPDIIYRLDPEGNIIYVNQSVEDYGYSTQELIGKNLLQLVHPDDREKAIHRINERRTGDRRTKSFEIRLLTKDLNTVSFESKAKGFGRFLISAEGIYQSEKPHRDNFMGTQGVARDITKRKQIEMEREGLIKELQDALEEVKTLRGFIPICANCKNIRDDEGYWQKLEKYIQDRSDAKFSHSICPECTDKHFSDLDI